MFTLWYPNTQEKLTIKRKLYQFIIVQLNGTKLSDRSVLSTI